MRYAMLICGNQDAWDEATAEESEDGMKDVYAWFEKWGRAGKIADGGVRLDHARAARTIRNTATGTVVVDGPFLESKEVVGGLVILEADSTDEAVDIASTWPGLTYRTGSVEVRPILPN